MCNVTAWRHTGLRTHWLMTLLGEFSGNCIVSYLSFVYGSTGGVCGRSLTAGKILFTGRQTCSLYLVLWLCDYNLPTSLCVYRGLDGHLNTWRNSIVVKVVLFILCFWVYLFIIRSIAIRQINSSEKITEHANSILIILFLIYNIIGRILIDS